VSVEPAYQVYGVWADTVGELVTYRYVGCQSILRDRHHADGWTTMRAHLRAPGSLLGAPLAISMLDTAGIKIDRLFHLGLTEVDVQLYEPALDVKRIHTIGTVVREGRTQLFTECRFEDADEPGRVIGAGAANWSVIEATPDGFEYLDPGPGHAEGPDVPRIAEAFELEPRPGGGFVLPSLSPRVGTDTLHHGPMLVGLEQSALQVAAIAAGTDSLALQGITVRFPKAGRQAPFTMTADVLSARAGSVGCRAQVTDASSGAIAVALVSYRVVS
jgi:acyl-coenzyme A thioesterase PaaI-like protein